MPAPQLSLRAKLALVSLALLALPWFGYRYVGEMERFLLEGQRQTLLDTARAVATALHDRPQLLDAPAQSPAPNPAAEDRRQKAEDLLQQLAQEPQRQEQAADGATPAAGRDTVPAESAHPGDTSQEIAAILKGLERSTARIWVVNRRYKLLALAGSLKRLQPRPADRPLARQAMEWLIPPPREDFDEAAPDDLLATGKEIANALQGLPGTRLRNSRDAQAVIVSAAYPIWSGDQVLGAVVAEESTNSILSVRNRALESLLLMTLAVFAVAAAVLMWFAFGVSRRIRQLRDEAEAAVDARGHIAGLLSGSQAGDEIGDLSRSFSAVLSRLSQQQAYLESLASRLSHELRTPVAVVRSSLENLRQTSDPDEVRVYITRAEEGVARLSTMLNRMTEATRLEQSLQGAERERFELNGLIAGCLQGYGSVYPQANFQLSLPEQPLFLNGSPELMAQLLDKLAANAVDFAEAGTPIRVLLEARDGQALLSVANRGPSLPPQGGGERLFSAMVSLRKPSAGGEVHLGLGLYVSRLIAEFHGGGMAAANAREGDGVVVTAHFPVVD